MFTVAIGMVGPDAHRPRHRRAEAALPRPDPAGRRDLVPAVQRARRRLRPRRPVAPGPCATATSGSSTARRCGRRAPSTADCGILLVRTDPDVPKHRGHHLLPGRHDARPGIDVRPLRQINGARPLQRGVPDRRAASRSRTSSATSTAAGASTLTTLANERTAIGGGGGGADFDELARPGPGHRRATTTRCSARSWPRRTPASQLLALPRLPGADRAQPGPTPGPGGSV